MKSEKAERYHNLAFEAEHVHRDSKMSVILIMISALKLNSKSENTKSQYEKLELLDTVESHIWDSACFKRSVATLSRRNALTHDIGNQEH